MTYFTFLTVVSCRIYGTKINSILFYFTHTCLDRLRKTTTSSLSVLHTTATIKIKHPRYKSEALCLRSTCCLVAVIWFKLYVSCHTNLPVHLLYHHTPTTNKNHSNRQVNDVILLWDMTAKRTVNEFHTKV